MDISSRKQLPKRPEAGTEWRLSGRQVQRRQRQPRMPTCVRCQRQITHRQTPIRRPKPNMGLCSLLAFRPAPPPEIQFRQHCVIPRIYHPRTSGNCPFRLRRAPYCCSKGASFAQGQGWGLLFGGRGFDCCGAAIKCRGMAYFLVLCSNRSVWWVADNASLRYPLGQ